MGNKTKGKVYMTIEMTPEERQEIKRLAALHTLPAAAYARMRALTPIDVEDS